MADYRDLVEYIVKNIVDKPDVVAVDRPAARRRRVADVTPRHHVARLRHPVVSADADVEAFREPRHHRGEQRVSKGVPAILG